MVLLRSSLTTEDKLKILTQDSQYDLACSCGVSDQDRRRRSQDDQWIYPVLFEDGRRTFLFKTLLSNVCSNNCKYCPLRASRDPRRCTLTPEETARTFMEYYRSGIVSGIFLSSGVAGNPDASMELITRTTALLRQQGFRGYTHLKVMPGASNAAIEEAVSLANAVSINIETAGEGHFNRISVGKNYLDDIIRPLRHISRLTGKGMRYARVKQTTQFIVGASDETDRDLVHYSWGLYKRLGLSRVYFSAYQRGIGTADLPGERSTASNGEMLTREHRLYQVDWLIRKYGFSEQDILFDGNGNLDLAVDPKEYWALRHPEYFPLDVNRAGKFELLRVPGLGHVMAERILALRREGVRISSAQQLGRLTARLKKAQSYLRF